MPYIASSSSAGDVRHNLGRLYTNRSRSNIMSLKENSFCLIKVPKLSKFLQTIKSIAEQFALISAPREENDIVLHYLNGLSTDFKEISLSIYV